jgi:succinoglycan biosynthesis protein ExoA
VWLQPQESMARPANSPPEQHGASSSLTVAVVVPLRNEIGRLAAVLANIEAQTRPPTLVVFADGASDDGSREWLQWAAETRPWLVVVDNPERIIPTALNRAIAEVECDVTARMDTHVDYEPHYLETVVGLLETNPTLAGAGAPYATLGKGVWGEAIAAVLRRPWAHGGAKHQVGATLRRVSHTRWTVYRTAAIRAAGGWDTQMQVNEDEEMDVRIRRLGDIWLVPTTRSTWYVRDSLPAFVRQMWRYGSFRSLTIHLHPQTLELRVLAPPLLTAGLAASLVARRRLGVRLTFGYLAAAVALGALSARNDGASWWRGAVVLPVIHLVYGAGFLTGMVIHAGSTPRLESRSNRVAISA